MDGNIRIDRLPLGHDTDRETDISLASSSGNNISTGPYHIPWAVCIILILPSISVTII
jgi:hypothetical protein